MYSCYSDMSNDCETIDRRLLDMLACKAIMAEWIRRWAPTRNGPGSNLSGATLFLFIKNGCSAQQVPK